MSSGLSPNRVEPLANCVVRFVTLEDMIRVSAVMSPRTFRFQAMSRSSPGSVVPMPTFLLAFIVIALLAATVNDN